MDNWIAVQERKLTLLSFINRINKNPVEYFEESFVQALKECQTQEQDCPLNLGSLMSIIFHQGFPPKTAFMSELAGPKSVKKIVQSFLKASVTSLYCNDMKTLQFFFASAVSSPWLDSESLKRFLAFCFNVLLSITDESLNFYTIFSKQEQWTVLEENVLSSMIAEIIIPFTATEAFDMFRNIFLKLPDINWKFALLFFSTIGVCLEDELKGELKEVFSKEIRDSLESDDEEKFVSHLLFVRTICAEPQFTSHPFSNYKCWFEHSFNIESSSLANTKRAVTNLCKFLTKLVPHETASAIRAHINRPPFIPLQLRLLWSDYQNLARTRLTDLSNIHSSSSISGPLSSTARSNSEDSLRIDADIREAVCGFVRNGRKIPANLIQSSIFRRSYFETQFLPRLMNPEIEIDNVDNDARRRLIAELEVIGKIPKSILKIFCTKTA